MSILNLLSQRRPGGFSTMDNEQRLWGRLAMERAIKVVDSSQASISPAGTSAEVLKSVSIPAGAWHTDGMGFRLFAYGRTAATANNKTIAIFIGGSGGTSLFTTGATAANDKEWFIDLFIVRTGAAAQRTFGQGMINAAVINPQSTAATVALTAATTLDIVVTAATAASDIIMDGHFVTVMLPSTLTA
jgi:hypothetical protein